MPIHFNPEDPKWTAYVLGELDESERALVEAELAESVEAQQLVAEIRELVGSLETELQREPVFKLAADQREAISENAKSVAPLKANSHSGRRKWSFGLALAATVLIALGALLLPQVQRAREIARNTDAKPGMIQLGLAQQNPHDVSRSNSSITDGEKLPMGYLQDDVQYFPPPSESRPSGKTTITGGRYAVREVEPTEPTSGAGVQYNGIVSSSNTELSTLPSDPRGRITPSSGQGYVVDQNAEANRYKSITAVPMFSQDGTSPPYSVTKPIYDKKTKDVDYTVAKPEYEKKPGFSYPKPPSSNLNRGFEQPRLQLGVTPRIIIQEEEEELLLGISKENQATSYDAARIERPGDASLGYRWRADGDPLLNYGDNEAYDPVTYNPFLPARENPLSTFSIDVDTASYSNVRRFLENNALPPKAAVRLEEMLNYFHYDYPQPTGDVPFSVTTEVAGCPWQTNHRLVHIGLKGREIAAKKRPATNLVFLLDVSGSMSDANKLPLVREAMKLLAEQLTENDRVAIVVYAGESGLVLDSTTGDQQRKIREAIDQLTAGGSTNGASGIQLAYEIAARNFVKDGVNRVLLATDGDFNVGITDRGDLIKLINEQAKSGVFLTTLGFGMGNLKDGTLEQLADKGNGNYAYIDDMREAKKVFVDQINGTLVTIAKDVKIQVEFNPAEVASYRLIGYENRVMAAEDFNNDKKDAGEIGAGHTVTALYEIVPMGVAAAEANTPAVDPLKYQPKPEVTTKPAGESNGELLTLKLRYKQPDGDTSKLIEQALKDSDAPYGKATADFKFAASVALFGMLLQDSPYKGTASYDAALELAQEGIVKTDSEGLRTEFLELVRKAKQLKR